MRDVLKNLIDGMSETWVKVGKYWRVPCKSAITQARQRLGARVMSQLFHRLVRPMATTETLGAFLNGLRIVVIDGTCFDVPDSDENARVFGRPSGCDLDVIYYKEIGKPYWLSLFQNWLQRVGVKTKVLKLSTTAAPVSFHLIPEQHRRCLMTVLQAASVTPDPIG